MFTRNYLTRMLLSASLGGALLLSTALPAFADDITGTSTVTGGSLVMSAADAPVVGLTLDGTDKTISDEFAVNVNDARGSGAGWNLQITSTTFSTGGASPKLLSSNSAAITGVAMACDQGTCTNPTNAVSYPLTVPADATAPTAVKFFNSANDTGMGDFTVTPTFRVSVPANAYAGAYNSVITISIVTGP